MSSLRIPLLLSLLATMAAPLAACGGDDDDDGDDGSSVDAGTDDGSDDGDDGDDGDGVDAGVGECVETEVLPLEYRPIASVSTGALDATTEGDVTTATVDATAGYPTGVADNPYIYIDLEAGTKVEIDDVDALESADWDIAFKRSNIRVNGGDSGPGDVAVAAVEGSLEEVTEAPADEAFANDDWVSEDCTLNAQLDGTPSVAMEDWYDYDDEAHTLTPKAEVYVVRTRSGSLVKLAIENYYDEADPTRGAFYSVSWAPL